MRLGRRPFVQAAGFPASFHRDSRGSGYCRCRRSIRNLSLPVSPSGRGPSGQSSGSGSLRRLGQDAEFARTGHCVSACHRPLPVARVRHGPFRAALRRGASETLSANPFRLAQRPSASFREGAPSKGRAPARSGASQAASPAPESKPAIGQPRPRRSRLPDGRMDVSIPCISAACTRR